MKLCPQCGVSFDNTKKRNGQPKTGRLSGRSTLYCSRVCALKSFRKKNPDYEWHKFKYRDVEATTRLLHRLEVLRAIGVGKDWVCGCNRPGMPQIDHLADRGYWSGQEHRARTNKHVIEDLWQMWREGIDITKIVQPLCASCNVTKFIKSRTPEELMDIYTRLPVLKDWQPEGPERIRKEGKWWEVSFTTGEQDDYSD